MNGENGRLKKPLFYSVSYFQTHANQLEIAPQKAFSTACELFVNKFLTNHKQQHYLDNSNNAVIQAVL